ncbi:5892_t:CDS:2 [Acaulospora colombiana]|uniref:5892_t:CDS:1 n=1 Tax=Acaulospora colombiana TaxID=27376 RepID=A0ACA9N4W8_9GLOM|nr:5892_t:CDS:2 [Acaulospora colombiana]
MFTRYVLLALATCTSLVAAHGALGGIFIDGVYYPGPNPSGDSGEFVIRAVNDINPVKGTDNPDMNCGHGATKAARVAPANPGSEVAFTWLNGERGPWVHNTGAVMTYMAACGSEGCANFDSANAQFFKIGELGRKPEGGYYMADLTGEFNKTLSVTLPKNLPAGQYLIRHELIAMQLGMSPGGAEFYPACVQIDLSGPEVSSAELPKGSDVVTFPGGYSDTDPGILDPHVYDPGYEYVFPGPKLINDSATSENPSGSGSTDTPASTSNGTPTSSTSATPSPTGGCNQKSKKAKREVKRVYKRIFRQGPLINKKAHKREVAKAIPQQRSQPEFPVARSRVMRGI